VRFPSGGSTYAYRTNDYTIAAGDFVMVPVGNSETPRLVQVESVGNYTANAVPYPLEKTKFILRKATEADLPAQTVEVKPVPPAPKSLSQAPKPLPEQGQPEDEVDPVSVLREKTRLLTASVILLVILVGLLSVWLYVVCRNKNTSTETEAHTPSVVYATATPVPTSTVAPTPTATPRPTTRPAATPRPTATPKRSTSTKKSSKTTDPYNAKSYSYADDFYDDYYDDFWDYEDAEDYWEDWND
jgi:hypothetical protein